MTCLNCGHDREIHRHNHYATYCGHPDGCNRYRPRRERWWQIWRQV